MTTMREFLDSVQAQFGLDGIGMAEKLRVSVETYRNHKKSHVIKWAQTYYRYLDAGIQIPDHLVCPSILKEVKKPRLKPTAEPESAWKAFRCPCGEIKSIKGICNGQCYFENCTLRTRPYRGYAGAQSAISDSAVRL